MRIISLTLKNYRNIKDAAIEFSPSVNVFYGKNAQGKTNLLEAIYLFSQGKSFRSGREKDLCAIGEEEARCELLFFSENRQNSLEIKLFSDSRKKEIRAQGIQLKRKLDLQGGFFTVLFAPEHLGLIKDGPGERRRFLDLAIGPLKARYAKALEEYEKVLLHKNALLKDICRHPSLADTLPVWNEKQAAAGAYITFMRNSYIEKIKKPAAEFQREISGGSEELQLSYSGFTQEKEALENLQECKDALYAAIEESREAELRAGMSLVGPQRDDIEITINGFAARMFSSQGQQRSAVLSLKLAEGQAIYDTTGEHPVMLLDDIMSELDAARRAYILKKIDGRQLVITSCDRARYNKIEDAGLFSVKGGQVKRV